MGAEICDDFTQGYVTESLIKATKLLEDLNNKLSFHFLGYDSTLRKIKALKALLSSVEAMFPQ